MQLKRGAATKGRGGGGGARARLLYPAPCTAPSSDLLPCLKRAPTQLQWMDGELLSVGGHRTTRSLKLQMSHPYVGMKHRLQQMQARDVLDPDDVWPAAGRLDAPGSPQHSPSPRRGRERRTSATTRTLVHNSYDGWSNPFSGALESHALPPESLDTLAALPRSQVSRGMRELQDLRHSHEQSSRHQARRPLEQCLLMSDAVPRRHPCPRPHTMEAETHGFAPLQPGQSSSQVQTMLPHLRPQRRRRKLQLQDPQPPGPSASERASRVLRSREKFGASGDVRAVQSEPSLPSGVRSLTDALEAESPEPAFAEETLFEGSDGQPLTTAVVEFLKKRRDATAIAHLGSVCPLTPASQLDGALQGDTPPHSSQLANLTATATLSEVLCPEDTSHPTQEGERLRTDAMSQAELRSLHLKVLVLNRHRRGIAVPKLKEICASLKVQALANPAVSDLLPVKVIFDAMTDERGVTPDVLRQHGWVFGGRTLDAQTFRKIDRSRTGVLRLVDLVRFFYPQLESKEARSMLHKLEAANDRSASLLIVSGPTWLSRYTAQVINEAFDLFMKLGPDPHTGLLHVRTLSECYLNDITNPLSEADLAEMMQTTQLDLEMFLTLVEHAFTAEPDDDFPLLG